MKTLIFLLSCLSTLAIAQPCQRLEFAEMDAISREELLTLRCQYKADMDQSIRDGMLDISNRCVSETVRMDRILGRKYQLKSSGNADFPYLLEINHMCRSKS